MEKVKERKQMCSCGHRMEVRDLGTVEEFGIVYFIFDCWRCAKGLREVLTPNSMEHTWFSYKALPSVEDRVSALLGTEERPQIDPDFWRSLG